MEGLKLAIIRQASETGMLYGSVSARDVADAAKESGHVLERHQVQIDTPIKTLGLFPVKVRLHPEVTVKVTVNVARSPEEAVIQAEKGAALVRAAEVQAEADAEKAAVEAIGVEEKTETTPVEGEGDVAAPKKAQKTRSKKADGAVEA
jgi:large subunit ribosomal protein L9